MIRFPAVLSTVVLSAVVSCIPPMRAMAQPDKTEIARGEDFFELGGDGRIRRVTCFFGEPPAIKP